MFKFKCNDTEWTIKEVDKATMNNEEKNDYTLGLTFYKKNEIWLLNNNVNKIRTLKHELMHVWLWEYGHSQDEDRKYSYEEVCEIVSSSNDFINEVVKQYINKDNVCHVENKEWDKLSDYEKEVIIHKLREQPLQIIQN